MSQRTKSKSSDKHITKISAKPRTEEDKNSAKPPATPSKSTPEAVKKVSKVTSSQESHPTAVSPKETKKAPKTVKNTPKSSDSESKKPFIIFRPFIAFGHYVRDSWRELRQVRWPDRKSTWQMTLAVLIYCAIMMIFILLLDMLFTFLFNLFIK